MDIHNLPQVRVYEFKEMKPFVLSKDDYIELIEEELKTINYPANYYIFYLSNIKIRTLKYNNLNNYLNNDCGWDIFEYCSLYDVNIKKMIHFECHDEMVEYIKKLITKN